MSLIQPLIRLNVATVIPARLESTRLPRKMLLDETGHPLILHTVARAQQLGGEVFVATDSREIAEACHPHCRVLMTGPAETGTDRIAQVVDLLDDPDLILHLQGDEPEIDPENLRRLIATARAVPACDMATLCTELSPIEQLDPNVVKVLRGPDNSAITFSRHPITPTHLVSRHVGVYCYRPDYLRWFVGLSRPLVEREAHLEQLRALWHKARIRLCVVNHPSHGIDTRDQYHDFVRRELSRKANA